jgi:hypothetical protein
VTGIKCRIFSTSGPITSLFKEIFAFGYGCHILPVHTDCTKSTVLNVEGGGVCGVRTLFSSLCSKLNSLNLFCYQ